MGKECTFPHPGKAGAGAPAAAPDEATPKAKSNSKAKAKAVPGMPAVHLQSPDAPCAIAASGLKGPAAVGKPRPRLVSFGKTQTLHHEVEWLVVGYTALHHWNRRTKHSNTEPRWKLCPEGCLSYALWAARKLAASIGVDTTQCVTLPVITAVPSRGVRNDGPSRWIADTGSGHDLIGGADVSSLLLSNASKVEDAVELHTANGVTFVDTCVPIQVAEVGRGCESVVDGVVPCGVVGRSPMHGTWVRISLACIRFSILRQARWGHSRHGS